MGELLDLESLRRLTTLPFGSDRVSPDSSNLPDWNVAAEGHWFIFKKAGVLCSIADFAPISDHIDDLAGCETVSFNFALSGSVAFNTKEGQWHRRRGAGGMLYAFPSGTKYQRIIGCGDQVRYIGLSLPVSMLVSEFGIDPSKYAADLRPLLETGPVQPLAISFDLTAAQLLAIEQLLDNKMRGALGERFVEAKIVELLCLTIDRFSQAHRHPLIAKSQDRERHAIERVAQILISDTDCPSIASLGRRVGMNRNKLTAVFREQFGLTPAAYQRFTRLNRARDLIVNSTMSMLEIANIVGFTSQASFTRAYHAQYGHPPREDRGRH